ncbi:hypothetical protein HYH03_006544 [Edaphochlamys debaryana]|uniref:RING-type domain-containing protein n=1 Tax=Edaphochlamys debaryana TaxID=47281 RepID=A0A835Y3H1_9CHLO|nr:hypothetical protein HYH03_006544 [Edaphochlamys debaryana]|eukprot:KAG2495271.1 hypothetical protein HYH03_006544 [Edaphochlamys debaryana]
MNDGGDLLELQCPICYGEVTEGGFTSLICGHLFHEPCLDQALARKKECPVCRCPAKPTSTRARDGAAQLQCPCKTGKPIKLFHLQRSRGGGAAASLSPLLRGQRGGSQGAGAALDAAVAAALAAAEQRERSLREALSQERQQVASLEADLERQAAELQAAQEKAERRKVRLASAEREHVVALARAGDERARLETAEREQRDEAARLQRALHGVRRELDAAKTQLFEEGQTLMRLRRELAISRTQKGGSAAPQPQQLAELLGEHKEDWQLVYSLKVDELRRAHEEVAALQAERAKAATEAEARVAATRLEWEGKLRAVTQQRDNMRREVATLENKLGRVAQGRPASTPPPATPSGSRLAAAAAAKPGAGQAANGGLDSGPGRPRPDPSSLQSRPARAQQPAVDEGEDEEAGVEEEEEGEEDGGLEALLATMLSDGEGEEAGPSGQARRSGQGFGSRGAEEEEPTEAAEEADEGELGQTADAGAGVSGGTGSSGLGGGGGEGAAEQDDVELVLDDADELVPALPRSLGLFRGQGGPGPGRAGAPAMAGAAAGATASTSTGTAARSAPAARRPFGGSGPAPSFAGRAPAQPPAGRSGATLIGEGPDGRGGTTRFPLVSSFGHNALKGPPSKPTAKGSGGGGGRKHQAVAAAGRIDAFLRPKPR